MYWKVNCGDDASVIDSGAVDGRFVLHRHRDAAGPHLDLRVERDGFLAGWRIDAVTLTDEAWATEKSPHSVGWLDRDGDAIREDAGTYAWVERGTDRASLLIRGRHGNRLLRVEREEGLPAEAVHEIRQTLAAHDLVASAVPRLIQDGIAARHRAVERLCGLGRELDGAAFDDGVWRRALAGLSLDEIHAQLRGFEVRFDRKYPPAPVSRPERLPDSEAAGGEEGRAEAAFAIACE